MNTSIMYTYVRGTSSTLMTFRKHRNLQTIIIHLLKSVKIGLLLLITSCSVTYPIEDKLYITKHYIGNYVSSYQHENKVMIQTTQCVFSIRNNPDIPEGAWCYVRVCPCRYDYHPQIARQLEGQFFSWTGSEKEYRLLKNLKL